MSALVCPDARPTPPRRGSIEPMLEFASQIAAGYHLLAPDRQDGPAALSDKSGL